MPSDAAQRGAARGLALPPARRQLLALALAGLLPGSASTQVPAQVPALPPAAPESATGWLQPRLLPPAITLRRGERDNLSLQRALSGKVTAVQLMFTGCSATCPMQGALFAAIAQRMALRHVALLSISIDVLGDDAKTLAAWQERFGPHPAWHTAVPKPADLDRLSDYLKGGASKRGTHTTQVFVFDRQARLSFRSGDTPSRDDVEALLAEVVRQG